MKSEETLDMIKIAKGTIIPNRKGGLYIYPNQVEAGYNILTGFIRNNKKHIKLCAQTQAGKTGTVQFVVHEIINRKEPYFVIYLTSISNNDLRDQSGNRLADTNFDILNIKNIHLIQYNQKQQILNLHSSNLTKKNIDNILKFLNNNNINNVLIICDESHYSQTVGSNIDKLVEKIRKIIPNLKELDITATGFAFMEAYDKKIRNCDILDKQVVYLKNGEKYFGFKELKESGRLKRIPDYFLNGEIIEKNVDIIIKDFLANCKKNGNGFCIWRVTSEIMDALYCYIKNKYPNIIMSSYTSTNDSGYKLLNDCKIADIHSDLKTPFNNPSIMFIKNGLSAGVTLPTTINIRLWVDGISKSTKDDTIIQSIGRNLGYPCDYINHSKFDDNYTIYSNIDIDNVIDFYKRVEKDLDLNSNLSGLALKGKSDKLKINNDNTYYISLGENEIHAKEIAQQILIRVNSKYRDYKVLANRSINSNKNNWYEDVLKGNVRVRSESRDSKNVIRLLHLNGYSTTSEKALEFKKSFNKCKKEMPLLMNNFVLSLTQSEFDKISKTKFSKLPYYMIMNKNNVDNPINNGISPMLKNNSRFVRDLNKRNNK